MGPSKHNCRMIVIYWFDDDYMFRPCCHLRVISSFTINNNKEKTYTLDKVLLRGRVRLKPDGTR